jgi:hypothetical protein
MTRWNVTCVLGAAVVIGLSACAGAGRKSAYVNYSSLRKAAAVLSHQCTRDLPSSDSNGLLWLAGGRRPLVYYASPVGDPPDAVLTTRGPSIPPWGLLWPCRPPVVLHYPSTHTASRSSTALLTVLAANPGERRTITLGQARFDNVENRNSFSGNANALVTPSGRILFFGGTEIRYANGPEISVRGLPHGWRIGALSVSPRHPFVFLAIAQQGRPGDEPCPAAVYRVTRTGSASLKRFDGCSAGVGIQWSPDGRHIAWFVSTGGEAAHLVVSDAEGRHERVLYPRHIFGAVWSPDSRSIAYGFNRDGIQWTAVVNAFTRARHVVAKGYPLAWSPDGKELALIRQSTVVPQPPGSIVAVPVAGGRARDLLEIPAPPRG